MALGLGRVSMANCMTEFLQIASGYLRYAPVPLQRNHVTELAKVLTDSENGSKMPNLAPFCRGPILADFSLKKSDTPRELIDSVDAVFNTDPAVEAFAY